MIDSIPWSSWLTSGTPPQWALLVICVVAFLRYGPTWQKQALEAAANRRSGQGARITELENKLRELRINCDKEALELRNEIRGLHTELDGLRRQRVSEQIAIISGILQTVDSPDLKRQLQMLESVQLTVGRYKGAGDVKRS
jgi:hypothetical protein